MVGSRPCTSPQPADADGLWRCCKGTPEMEQHGGLRSLGLNVGDVALFLTELRLHVLRVGGPTSEGRDSQQIFKDHPPAPLGG